MLELLSAQLDLIVRALHLRLCALAGERDDGVLADYEQAQIAVGRLARDVPNAFLNVELSPSETVTVWTLVATTIDPVARELVARLSGGRGVTEGLLKELVYGAGPSACAVSELGPSGVLCRLGFIERSAEPHPDNQVLSASRRVIGWVHGDRSVDPELRGIAALAEPGSSQLEMDARVKDDLVRVISAGTRLVALTGPAGCGKRSVLLQAAAECGYPVLELDALRLAVDPTTLKRQLRLVVRESRLGRLAVCIRNLDILREDSRLAATDAIGSELVPEVRVPLFVTFCRPRPLTQWGLRMVSIAVERPSSDQRAALWLRELGQGTQDDAEYLATQYPLAPALIHHAAEAAKARANGRKMQPEDIYAGVRAVLDDKLGDYAKRVEVTQTWDDLVIPEDQMEAVQYLIARIRQRRTVYEQWGFAAKVGKGLGTSALFSGPPGTGKTMVAALIAKELGLELYQVDMARVVSKFIGETERNLSALFDAAEAGHAVLLFDEADSLFGKRTEVKSSNDRYANLETNYLLQRLESFTGICLLTSNHESNIDPAFQRRLSLHLRFELPEAEERAALWQAMLPAAAPVDDDVDFETLGRKYVMSGGYIRNAALRAAFLAADEGSVITGPHLERAAKLEYEGMGKIAAA